jgi:hypothetical protein
MKRESAQATPSPSASAQQPAQSTKKETAMAQKRTTHRSTSGTKLYAVRNADGTFKDIQTYKRAHGQDVKRTSKAEKAKKSG